MAKYTLHKVTTLPVTLEPNAVYYVKEGDRFRQVITDIAGVAVEERQLDWTEILNTPTNLSGFGLLVEADGRYLQSFVETDPVFNASAASGITATNITNWDTAFGWGDHAGLYDNYQSWNLKTNGIQRTTIQTGGTLDIVATNNITATYGAGGVVTLDGTHNHDGLYYTKALADGRFFNVTGDDVVGDSTFTGKTSYDGNVYYNTQNGQKGLFLNRYAESAAEFVKMYMEDIIAHFYYQNDERHARFKWTINNSDTESNAGANANTHTFEFLGNEFGAYLYLDGQTILHSGNISSYQAGAHTHSFDSLTGKPTTISGYGITDAYTKTESDNNFVNTTGDTMTGSLEINTNEAIPALDVTNNVPFYTEIEPLTFGTAVIRGVDKIISAYTDKGILDIEMSDVAGIDKGATLTFSGNKGNFGRGYTNVFAGIKGGKSTDGNQIKTGYLSLYTNSGTQLEERMRITFNGNVGIGTTNPTEKLEVTGNAKISGSIPSLIIDASTTAIFEMNDTGAAVDYKNMTIQAVNGRIDIGGYNDAKTIFTKTLTLNTGYGNDQSAIFTSTVEATSFIKSGGTSSQFLKADGSVDSNTYSITGHGHTIADITNLQTTLDGKSSAANDQEIIINSANLPNDYTDDDVAQYISDNNLLTKVSSESVVITISRTYSTWALSYTNDYETRVLADYGTMENKEQLEIALIS